MIEKTKILINAFAARRGGGITYIDNFLRYFPENENISLTVLCGTYNEDIFRKSATGKKNVEIKVIRGMKNVFVRGCYESFILPFVLLVNHFQVYYAPSGLMTLLLPVPGVKKFTALRNMLPFDDEQRKTFPWYNVLRWKMLLLKYLFLLSYRLADGVVFISEYSKSCVEKYLPNIGKKSVTIYHGLNVDFLNKTSDCDLLEKFNLESGKYVLYVSILDYYKAQLPLMKDWLAIPKDICNYPLVLTGPCVNQYGQDVVNFASNHSDRIKYIGPVEYKKLPQLYQNAKALIFASSCECCPNILLEKMSAGVPVFSSDYQPMPEFGGEDVFYFNPYKTGNFKEIFCREMQKTDNMANAGKKVRQRAETIFSWDKTVRETLKFLTN